MLTQIANILPYSQPGTEKARSLHTAQTPPILYTTTIDGGLPSPPAATDLTGLRLPCACCNAPVVASGCFSGGSFSTTATAAAVAPPALCVEPLFVTFCKEPRPCSAGGCAGVLSFPVDTRRCFLSEAAVAAAAVAAAFAAVGDDVAVKGGAAPPAPFPAGCDVPSVASSLSSSAATAGRLPGRR